MNPNIKDINCILPYLKTINLKHLINGLYINIYNKWCAFKHWVLFNSWLSNKNYFFADLFETCGNTIK